MVHVSRGFDSPRELVSPIEGKWSVSLVAFANGKTGSEILRRENGKLQRRELKCFVYDAGNRCNERHNGNL